MNKLAVCMSKLYAVCQECDSLEIEGSATVFWDHVVGEWLFTSEDELHHVWCEYCEGECNVDYITEEELKVRQVKNRLKGVSV